MKRLYATCPGDKFAEAIEKHESVVSGDNAAAFDETNLKVYLKLGNDTSCQQYGTYEAAAESYGNICEAFAGGAAC